MDARGASLDLERGIRRRKPFCLERAAALGARAAVRQHSNELEQLQKQARAIFGGGRSQANQEVPASTDQVGVAVARVEGAQKPRHEPTPVEELGGVLVGGNLSEHVERARLDLVRDARFLPSDADHHVHEVGCVEQSIAELGVIGEVADRLDALPRGEPVASAARPRSPSSWTIRAAGAAASELHSEYGAAPSHHGVVPVDEQARAL